MLDIRSVGYKTCTGCAACMNICPKGAISMQENGEGFLYPAIDENKCIHCGLCYKKCPVIFPEYKNNENPDCYAVMADDALREKSSSGGMFSIIADYVLRRDGYVCGAVYGEDKISVQHELVSSEEELAKLRGSKYIQSKIGFAYTKIKEKLNSGALVFFTGCPCQVAGLKSYLGKEYDNLITADLVCHGVPSVLVFEKFLKDLPDNGPIESINFRQKKKYGWTHALQIVYKNGVEYYKPRWECDFYKVFLDSLAIRKSCGDCKFNKLPRQGDFTFGDFWGIGEQYPELDDKKGTGLVLINNDKADRIFKSIKHKIDKVKLVDVELARKSNARVFTTGKEHWERDRFMKIIQKYSFSSSYKRIKGRWFDVGIVGWWYGKNYGSALTYYALHEVVEGLGYDTLMLEWPCKKKPYPPIQDNFVRRFAKKHYNMSAQYTFDEYPSLNNHINQFLVGSDQLWNYWCSKNMGNYYMLDFVRADRKKISYATSFGHPDYPAPKEVCEQQAAILKTFDAISVREDDGVKICRDVFGVEATQVFDPVFLCPKEKYLGLITEANISFDKPYLLAYILSPNKEKGEMLKTVADKLGLDLLIILDGQTDIEENKKRLGIENVRQNIGIEEWLAYIYNASFVITDSFHGTCFSIIFEKQFICILNKARGISRFETLSRHLALKNFMVNDISEINDRIAQNETVDYNAINHSLSHEVSRSYDWLKNALAMRHKVVDLNVKTIETDRGIPKQPTLSENNSENAKSRAVEFTCFAGCVTRDVFRFISPEIAKPKFSFGFANISNMFLPKLNIDRNTITEGTAYLKRNIWYDLTKTNLSKILESDSEWFIFDLITERFPIMEFIIDQQTGFATKSPEFVQNYLKWVSDKTFKHIRKVRDYFLDDLFEELDYENSIKNFCDKIIERFGQNKIILNEVYLSEYYLAKNNEIKMFNSDGAYKIIDAHNQPDIVNKFLRKLYSLFRKYLPSAYYISMPNYSYSDENHWFGLHPLHFNRNYYEYVSNCVRTIVSISNNKNSIALSLELLHKEQSDNNKCFIETNKCLSQAAKKFDVGIYGWWGHENFGGILTYYALNKAIQKLGYSVLMIQEALGATNARYKIPDNCIAMRFAKKHYNCSDQKHYKDLPLFNKFCDAFVVGGDQLWNYRIPFTAGDNFLDFVDDHKKKLSYSTSFGQPDHNPPLDFIEKHSENLRRFDAVSVREDYAVKIAKNIYGIEATQTIDAIFLPDIEDFDAIAQAGSVRYAKPYLTAYILNPTANKRRIIECVAKKLDLDIVVIPDADSAYHKECAEVFSGIQIMDPLSVENFTYTYKNASYVITDSFHGTCMSYIYKKDFSVFYNEKRGAARFESLMNLLKLENRRIRETDSNEDIDNNHVIGRKINWEEAIKNVNREKDYSFNWLKNALKKDNKTYARLKEVSVEGLSSPKCMGCGACVSICPTNAITLQPDALGYYRRRIDREKCTLCGLCAKICPAIKLPKKDTLSKPQLYAFVGADKDLVDASSSGGVFSLLAKQVLRKKGYVFGAAWREDFSISHIMIDSVQDLSKLQKSKYMQSYTGDIFRTVRQKLKEDKPVLFCGCPCQIAGLKAYLGKPYDNLLLVDLLCANAPSTMFFQKYLKESFGNDIKAYEFRDKSQGWNGDSVKITDAQNNIIKKRGAAQDMYQSVYHNHTMCPPHCENCQYQSIPRYGDLTIGDFWGIQKVDPSIDASKGVSALLVNNEKGRYYFDNIPSKDIRIAKEEPLDYLGGNGFAVKGKNWASPYRDLFYKNIRDKTFAETLAIIDQAKSAPTVSLPQNILPQEATIPLSFFSSRTRFEFDPTCFEEHNLNGYTVLTVKPGKDKVGIRAFLPLNQTLDTNKTYEIAARFKIRSNSKEINFHIYSDSGKFQVVKSVVFGTNKDFIAFKQPFKPTVANCTKFMIGACHITGPEAFFLIDYITIREI